MSALTGQCPEVASKPSAHVVTYGHSDDSDESMTITRGDTKWPQMEHNPKDMWLELALSRLQHHQAKFSDEDHRFTEQYDVKRSNKGRRKGSQSKLKSKAQKLRLPSLCATHPSLYGHRNKLEAVSMTKPSGLCMSVPLPVNGGEASQEPLPPWQDYSDAKRMGGYGDPSLPNPTPRMLKVDTRSRQTNIVSPTFLIGLPCGGLVEAATIYEHPGLP